MKKLWVLVYTWRGLIQKPEIFFDERSVSKRKREILKNFNPEYDEIGVFEKEIV